MGESSYVWTKKQKVSATQISHTNSVCEDCGRKWTTTLAEVPVTIFIKDIDDYYKKLSNNLLEEVKPPMVLCVFRPSDRDIWDTAITLSCVAPRQNSPYNWRINHKQNGPAAASGCQIIPLRGNDLERRNEDNNPDQEMATIKPSKSENINPKEEIDIIKEEIDDENEEMIQDDSLGPLADEKKLKSDNDSKTVSLRTRLVEGNNKYTPEDRARVAKDALDIGNQRAAVKWSAMLNKRITESTVRSWKAKYKEQLLANGSADTLDVKKQGRPTKVPADLEAKILKQIESEGAAGHPVSYKTAVTYVQTAMDIRYPHLKVNSRKYIRKPYVQSFLRRNGLYTHKSNRACTLRTRLAEGNNKYTPEERARVAKDALDIGNQRAAVKWSAVLNKRITESTVRSWNAKYKEQLLANGSADTLDVKKQGRPTKSPADLEAKILKQIESEGAAGHPVSYKTAVTYVQTAMDIRYPHLKVNSRKYIGKPYVQSFLRRNGLVTRKSNRATMNPPIDNEVHEILPTSDLEYCKKL